MKPIDPQAIPRALELAQRYRLLNEPEQAASICHDILAVDPADVDALRTLLLATTDQFGLHYGATFGDAERIIAQMASEYERAYYTGVARERWARMQLEHGGHHSLVGDWLRHAMEDYERAEALRETGNDDAILRWNACSRLIQRVPDLAGEKELEPLFGD
jgi:hypothetical protein